MLGRLQPRAIGIHHGRGHVLAPIASSSFPALGLRANGGSNVVYGAGLGNVFASLYGRMLPIIRTVVQQATQSQLGQTAIKAAKREMAKAARNAANRVAKGESLRKGAKEDLKAAKRSIASEIGGAIDEKLRKGGAKVSRKRKRGSARMLGSGGSNNSKKRKISTNTVVRGLGGGGGGRKRDDKTQAFKTKTLPVGASGAATAHTVLSKKNEFTPSVKIPNTKINRRRKYALI